MAVHNTERLLLGLIDCKYGGKGVKKGVFNVLGGVSKILFWTTDCDDTHILGYHIDSNTKLTAAHVTVLLNWQTELQLLHTIFKLLHVHTN